MTFLLGHADTTKVPLSTGGDFWEHLSEHIVLALSCVIIGILIGYMILSVLHNKKLRIDYTLDKGMIMRMPVGADDYPNSPKKRKQWLIVNPSSLMEWLDVILLCFYDRGKDKIIDRNSRKRIRIISIIVVILVIVCGLSAITLILSAFEKSMDIFDYIRYR